MSNKTVLSHIYRWEKEAPDKLHFIQPTGGGQVREYSWRECMDETRRMAAYLQSLNLPPRSNIALIGKNTAHWMMVDWAIWMAGHVSVPLYPTLNADTVAYILEHSESKLVVVGKLDDWDEMKPGVPDDLPGIALPLAPETKYPGWEEIIAKHEPLQGEPERDPEELATIVYTSGSTGRPKGVMQSFGALLAVGDAFCSVTDNSPEDRMLSYLPLSHIMERAAVEMTSCIAGFRVYFAESLDTFVQDLRRAQPTAFISVPRLWTKFKQGVDAKLPPKKQKLLFKIPVINKKVKNKILTQLGLEHARFAGTGSAPLPQSVVNWYRSLGLELLEAYGMTEDCALSHMTKPGEVRVGYVGKPHDGVQARIAEDGEVQVKSPGTTMGYYKDPEKTAEAFTEDGFFKTGDMGEYDEGGRLKITGRVKELFKTSKGKYVAPNPIENKLMTHDALEAVCVGGANQTQTFALCLLSEELRAELQAGSLDKAALEQELAEHMDAINPNFDHHERLKFLVIVKETWGIDNGFLTPTMKIKRNVIEDHYESQVDGWFGQKKKVIWES